MRRKRIVHTRGKTHAGGERGGFFKVWNVFIPSLVRKAERPPTDRGDGETDQEFLPFFFHKQSPVYRIRGAQVFYSSAVCRPPIWKWVHRYR